MRTHTATDRSHIVSGRKRRSAFATKNFFGVLVSTLVLLLVSGCTTPDLKPFSDASATLSSSVRTGGDLAIKPLARMPIWDGARWIQPNEIQHPYNALAQSWELRTKTMDAVLMYSASLSAINEASSNRKANAAELVGSVKQLASAVPSIGTGVSAAGDLIVFGLGTYVEVKAWHDMKKAVKAADPAIQLVAKALTNDFASLAVEFRTKQRAKVIQSIVALGPVEEVHEALDALRETKRGNVAADPGDTIEGAELARVDALIRNVEVDLNKFRAEKSAAEELLVTGADFFQTATRAVEAWAEAHTDIVKAFENQRSPNLALLAARAQELREIVDNLKK